MDQTKPTRMHTIAIVRTFDHYYNYGDDNDVLVQAISEWEEVDHETFLLLQSATNSTRNNDNLFVIERLSVNSPEVITSVSAYVKHVAAQKAAADKAAAEKKAKADARRLKKLAADEKARLALYEQLQAEFGKDPK